MGRYITNSGGIHTTGYQPKKKNEKKKKEAYILVYNR